MKFYSEAEGYQFTPLSDGRPSPGVLPLSRVVKATNRSGSAYAAGDIVQFDFAQTAAETTTVTQGAASSIWVNTVAPTAAGVLGGAWMGIAMAAIDNDSSGPVMIQGVADAFALDSGSGGIAVGDRLPVIATTKDLDSTAAAGEIYFAVALEATASTSRTLISVLFNGVPPGFGQAT